MDVVWKKNINLLLAHTLLFFFFSKNKPAGLLENLEGVDDEETMDDEEKPRRISPF